LHFRHDLAGGIRIGVGWIGRSDLDEVVGFAVNTTEEWESKLWWLADSVVGDEVDPAAFNFFVVEMTALYWTATSTVIEESTVGVCNGNTATLQARYRRPPR